MNVQQFINQLVPANYFLTKSMELTKVNSSGTLWYTKKFLVYYYYIFLSDNITVRDDVTAICDVFNKYIDSLPKKVQSDATKFFYASKKTADLRSDKFRLFYDFAGSPTFQNDREKTDYYEMAKKYYFAFLMESGGQSGVKAYIKEKLYQSNFCFSNIDSIIDKFHNGRPYNLTGVKNDYMAFLRNERQVLFYYGFFHSKSSGSNDKEFSSLTPVGELALKSNFYEFLALWEHQKLKMLSQPVTVDIQNIGGQQVDYKNFRINTNPYLSVLQWLNAKPALTSSEYQYVVSRLYVSITNINEINILIENLEKIKEKIQSFNRWADIATEDFQKELKKYILGLRSDLKFDKRTNPLNICKLSNSKIEVINKLLLSELVKKYTFLSEYKNQKYGSLFDKCQQEIQRQYEFGLKGQKYIIDGKIKIEWDMYNIHIDLPIILSISLIVSEILENKKITENTITNFADTLRSSMPNLLNSIGLSSKQSLIKELKSLVNAFETENFEKYLIVSQTDYEVAQIKYQTDSIEDLRVKIKTESDKPTLVIDGIRKRNSALIHLIKAYNEHLYKHDGVLNCECCGKTTFITISEDTYLEYHHLIPFNGYDGPDHFLNIYALCPMCHRKMHFLRLPDKPVLYKNLSKNNYLQTSINKRLKTLYTGKKLRSYHLEFLLAENAISEIEYNQVLSV
jgi:5-methylcytosine-specific restriction endonuclease McrA